MPIVTVLHFNQFYAGLCHLAKLGMIIVTFNAFIFILEYLTILQGFMIISVPRYSVLLCFQAIASLYVFDNIRDIALVQ